MCCPKCYFIFQGDAYWTWLAQYMVLKRASIEPNFHTLYSSFLESMESKMLHSEVLRETFGNIETLLR